MDTIRTASKPQDSKKKILNAARELGLRQGPLSGLQASFQDVEVRIIPPPLSPPPPLVRVMQVVDAPWAVRDREFASRDVFKSPVHVLLSRGVS